MTAGEHQPPEPLVVGVSGRRMVVQGLVSGAFGVLLLYGMAALGSWYLGLLALLVIGIAAFSFYQAKTFQPVLVADHRGVSLAKTGPGGGTLHIPWEEVERVFVHKVRGVNVRLLCVLPRDVERHLPADPAMRGKAEKSIEITGAPYSANLVAASISNERALDTVRALSQGRCAVG